MVDRALDSGRRVMEEYEAERSLDEPKDSPRARIAQNLKRQIDTVSERWSMLSHRSEDWQQWIDEVLRVSVFGFTVLEMEGQCHFSLFPLFRVSYRIFQGNRLCLRVY